MLCDACDEAVLAAQEDRILRDRAEAIDAALRRSGLPAAYCDGSRLLGDLPARCSAAIAGCQLLGNGSRGLFLWGPARTYKTSVAAAWLAAQIRGGASGLYASAMSVTSDIMASYRRDDGESRAQIIERLAEAPCLVIDDFGKEKASAHAAGVWFEVLDARYCELKRGRWLIVTSNWPIDAIVNRFDCERELSEPLRHRLSVLCTALPMGDK